MKPLSGKKLLVLGGAANEVPLVERAQELGVYVIVADYHTDFTLSPAKKIAEEAWTISWADIDGLEKLCREAKVDGVLAGYSELRVDSMIQLCARMNMPCYITPEQLEITRDKIKFKETCRASGVPVVHEYDGPESVNKFPVIVKPVDRAGSIGISIASNPEELAKAYDYAMEMSITKQVIIEDYISNGIKVDMYYQILDGEIRLLPATDTIFAQGNGIDRVVQNGWTVPSVHMDAFTRKVDPAMRKMIENMGMHNGYIFFSGFALPEDEFVFFECGYRLCGGHFYHFWPFYGGWDTQDLLIYHALTGSAAAIREESRNDPDMKCVTVNFDVTRGTVREIVGMEEIAKIPQCKMAMTRGYVGQVCTDDTAILSKVGMVHFCSHSADVLADCVKSVYDLFRVTGVDGEDMLYDRMDPELIRHWWDDKKKG